MNSDRLLYLKVIGGWLMTGKIIVYLEDLLIKGEKINLGMTNL